MNKKADELATQLQKLSVAYHNFGTSPVEDPEYDRMKRELRALSPEHPFLKQVGAQAPVTSHLKKARHKIHMGSVANAMNAEEFTKWWNKLGSPVVFATVKVDGLSMNLEYENGQFKRAITRGDGIEGEDVTANVLRAGDLPLYLTGHEDFTGSVRAEVLLYKNDWKKVDPEAKTARNAAAGTVRRKNGKGAQYLRVIAHDLYPADSMVQLSAAQPETVAEKFEQLKAFGFKTPLATSDHPVTDPAHVFADISRMRNQLEFEIDGVVFTVNDLGQLAELGIDGEACYRGQIAWKFPSETTVTEITGVEWSVGHTGAINPVAKLKPVVLGGVTVTNASLCNPDEIERLGLKWLGSTVQVSRQGDVIPKILSVLAHDPAGVDIEIPTACPVCGGPVNKRQNVGGDQGVILYCTNPECAAKPIGKLKRWVKSLNILGMGDEVLEALLEAKVTRCGVSDFPSGRADDGQTWHESHIVEDVVDLYNLEKHPDWCLPDLKLNGRRLGEKRAASILKEIEKTRKLTVDQLLGSIGIQHLGKRRVALIRKAHRKYLATLPVNGSEFPPEYLDNVRNWLTSRKTGRSFLQSHAECLGIPGIAEEIQRDIDNHEQLIEQLLTHVKVVAPVQDVEPAADSPLVGRSFCFTGCRPTPEEKDKLARLGAEEKSGVSKGLTHLVTKTDDTTSSKAMKAKELGVELITYAQFKSLLDGK